MNRLSILERLERGEISLADAEAELEQSPESETPVAQVEATESMEIGKPEEEDVLTRRERKLAPAGKLQELTDSWQWPWESEKWQWVWQNSGYPVYVSHSIDITEESELKVVLHQGDLFIRGWSESILKINGAAFDIRVGQDENVIGVASSTGQLQIWIPDNITRVEARVLPGDVWLRSMFADIDVCCQSGDLGCERIKGNVRVQVNGGDVRLMGIEGPIDADVTRGNTDVRDISSTHVSLKSSEGDIWLSLNSVSSGEFRCESVGGDINLLINGELACELLAEATGSGRVSPVILPWQKLLERSKNKLHGILMEGGAFINLTSRGGNLYIQKALMDIFPTSPY
ncbi:DUF4097 family beta strand repeat-containing protein [Candidatus Poribacteria bacterium]